MQFTGASSDSALVALHDCDNDVNAAIDILLEGNVQGQWLASSKKKKKAPSNKVITNSYDFTFLFGILMFFNELFY